MADPFHFIKRIGAVTSGDGWYDIGNGMGDV